MWNVKCMWNACGMQTGGGSWIVIPSDHLEVTLVRRRAAALTLHERVFPSPSPHTSTLCPMFSLNLSVVGLAPPRTYQNIGLHCVHSFAVRWRRNQAPETFVTDMGWLWLVGSILLTVAIP